MSNKTPSKTVRVDLQLDTRGITKQTGEDELTITLGKLLPSLLQKEAKKLQSDCNNANSDLRKIFGRNVQHPQGGVATMLPKDDKSSALPRLADVMVKAKKFEQKAHQIQDEIDKYVRSGGFDDTIKKLGIDRARIPSVSFHPVVAVDTASGTTFADVQTYLDEAGVYPTGLKMVRLIPSEDERLLVIMRNLAEEMGKHYTKLQARIDHRKMSNKEPLTKEDVIRANHKFCETIRSEREKIRLLLGDTPQMAQVDALITQMSENGQAMMDVFEEVNMSSGEKLSEAINIDHLIVKTIKSDKDMMRGLGIDDII